MEEDTEKLIQQLDGMIERMESIGTAARLLIEAVDHNSDVLHQEGGKDGMYMRHCRLQEANPVMHEQIKDRYSVAVIETMKQVVAASNMLREMTEQFICIPDDKKKFASKMN